LRLGAVRSETLFSQVAAAFFPQAQPLRRDDMAKSQKKSNREIKKPKKDKAAAAPAALPFAILPKGTGAMPSKKK
jgi:hypothetical protein